MSELLSEPNVLSFQHKQLLIETMIWCHKIFQQKKFLHHTSPACGLSSLMLVRQELYLFSKIRWKLLTFVRKLQIKSVCNCLNSWQQWQAADIRIVIPKKRRELSFFILGQNVKVTMLQKMKSLLDLIDKSVPPWSLVSLTVLHKRITFVVVA